MLCYVMTVLQACRDWMSLMEGAGPGLIAVLVLELNYMGCTLLVVARHVPYQLVHLNTACLCMPDYLYRFLKNPHNIKTFTIVHHHNTHTALIVLFGQLY